MNQPVHPAPANAVARVIPAPEASPEAGPLVSVVIPAYNEAENITPLVHEVLAALAPTEYGASCEVLVVDDGSTDSSVEVLSALMAAEPRVRHLRHKFNSGQSAAVWTGVVAARGGIVVTLDGDGQNDPACIPDLLQRFAQTADETPSRIVCGIRTQRQDTLSKKLASRIANGLRRRLLNDEVSDTGCGLKVFARGDFLALPPFNHMHRYLPALMKAAGAKIYSVPVRHRARLRGVSKYGVGGRALVGIYDLVGVAWLMRRRLHRGASLQRDTLPWQEFEP